MKNLTVIIFCLCVVSLTIRCSKDNTKEETKTTTSSFKATVIPSEIERLYEEKGNNASDTVWVYIQGGPTVERGYDLDDYDDSGTPLFPFFDDDLRVYPFQAQNLNPEIETAKEFTFEDAKIESSTTVEIVKKVVEHFKNQNKVVYLIGHSYGSFVVNEVLAKYGNIARKTISLNGRLNIEKELWEGFSRGEEWLYDDKGENPRIYSKGNERGILDQNMSKIAAGLGFNRYTEKLKNTDLSDVIFVTSQNDPFVGDFTAEAIEFADQNAETLITLKEAGHSAIFSPYLMNLLHQSIIKEE